MKVYVIFREEWDNFCYEDQDWYNDAYGVFTDKNKAIEVAKELNSKESFEVKGKGDHGLDASRGMRYYICPCETDVIGNISDNRELL